MGSRATKVYLALKAHREKVVQQERQVIKVYLENLEIREKEDQLACQEKLELEEKQVPRENEVYQETEVQLESQVMLAQVVIPVRRENQDPKAAMDSEDLQEL